MFFSFELQDDVMSCGWDSQFLQIISTELNSKKIQYHIRHPRTSSLHCKTTLLQFLFSFSFWSDKLRVVLYI